MNTGTRRAEALQTLAGIVRDASAPLEVRDIAYQGLYEVSGRLVTEWPITRNCQGRFTFPKDIDRAFVAECGRPSQSQVIRRILRWASWRGKRHRNP